MNQENENLLAGLDKDENGNYQFEDKRSVSGNSRRAEEELFEDLANFNQGYEPHFFQSDLKRFGTGGYPDVAQSKSGRQSLEEGSPLERRVSSQLSRKNSFTNNKKYKEATVKKGSDEPRRLLAMRKACRLATLACCNLLVLGITILLYSFGKKSHHLKTDWTGKEVTISMNNCRLYIEACVDCRDTGSVELDYRSSIRTVFSKIIPGKETFSHSDLPDAFKFKIVHYDEINACNLRLVIPQTTVLKKLTFDCSDECVLIHRRGAVVIQELSIEAMRLSMNMATTTLGSIAISVQEGFVQFNDLRLLPGVFDRRVLVKSGDIIVETSSSLQVKYLTACENYCFSGTTTADVAPAVKSPIAAPLSQYVTQLHKESLLFRYQWAGVSDVCNSQGCSGAPQIECTNFDGNIFINALDSLPGILPKDAKSTKGSRYFREVDIPIESRNLIEFYRNQTTAQSLANLLIRFSFGNFDALSLHGSRWVYTDHPILSIVKPWWLSFFTLGKAIENTKDVKTYLTPGFCPYRHTMSRENNLQISDMLSRHLPLSLGVVSYTKNTNDPLIPDVSTPRDGFAKLPKIAQFSDEWVEVEIVDGEKDTYGHLYLTRHLQIFLMIGATVVGAFFASCGLSQVLVDLVFKSFVSVKQKLYHIEFYWEIFGKVANSKRKNALHFTVEEEESHEKIQTNFLKNFNFKLATKTSDLPSTTAFVDYLVVELWTSTSSSLRRFYSMAFEEEDLSKIVDMEMQNVQNDKVPLRQLKSLYQQMCFLMGYKESELSTPESLSMLNEKGMEPTSSDSHRQFLIRLTMNTSTDLSLSYYKSEKKQTSLQIFLEKFCEHTDFDEDKLPFDIFIDRYTLFCKLNHMEIVLVDHIVLKNKFGIESRTFFTEMVGRDYDQIYMNQPKDSNGVSFFLKPFLKFRFCFRKKYYNLKVERVRNVNLFLAGRLNESDVGHEEYKKIARLAILEDGWWWRDLLSVLIELVIDLILSVPFIALFIYQEIEHSLYSLRDESINIYGFNLSTADVWLLPEKIFKNLLVAVMFVLFIFFWLSSLFNMTMNIFRLDYPWLKAFDPSRSHSLNSFNRFLNVYQWSFIIVSTFVILWYVYLVVVWNMITSVVKPQAYLSSATMSLAFIYLVYNLQHQFRFVARDSSERLTKVFKDIWGARISVIVKRMLKYTSERETPLTSKDGTARSQLVNEETSLKNSQFNLLKVASEHQRHENFINFFFSLIKKETTLRANLEKLLLEPPFNFNKYMTQFLCNILFISKSLQVDKFNIEKNIKLCASVVFYYRDDIEFVPVTLGDIGELKRCACDNSTVINQRNECFSCHSKEYEDEFVKENIRHIKIDENSKVLVDMLDILSNLQKRRTDQVLKAIGKIFSDCFTLARFEHIKPSFDLLHYVIFNLIEDYDYVRLSKIYMDFLKKSIKADMNLTEILMLYLLNDSYIVANDHGQIFDFASMTSIFKRQICTTGKHHKERRMLVKYLSLETSFSSVEPKVHRELVLDIRSDINSLCDGVISIPVELVWSMLHIPLYFTQNINTVSLQIAKHAENANISPDISGLVYNFSMIADRQVVSKQDFEGYLRRSSTFHNVKKRLDINFKELFGIIYLMKGDTNNDYFNKVIAHILNKHHFEDMTKPVDDLLVLCTSLDKHAVVRALAAFGKYCTHGELQFKHLCTIVCSFKDIANDEAALSKACEEFFDMLPSKKTDNAKLQHMFAESIKKKNASKYKSFKENLLYINKKKSGYLLTNKEIELQNLLDLLELFFDINFGTDFRETLTKYKELIPEFEVNSLFHLCLKLLKTVHGFKVSNKDVMSERIKEAFSNLGEIMIGRPNDYEQLWIMLYSSDHTMKLHALQYFSNSSRANSPVESDRFQFHMIFIDKRVKFIRNQKEFFNKCVNFTQHKPFQFGLSVIKRFFMRNFETQDSEINLMLSLLSASILNRDGEKKDLSSFDMGQSKATRFYSALMDFIVNQNSTRFGNYFLEDHDEPMLRTLSFCRYCSSPNEIVNKIFEQLIKNGHIKLCSLLYFFFLVVGLIQRRKIDLKEVMEQEINEWVNIKPEFMEFIELYTDREASNIVDMVYKIQNRIFYNLYGDKELQKASNIFENVLKKEFYENIHDIISGEQPSIPYLSDLFKIPLKKMKFIYILTSLKLNFKLDYVFEQFINNQDVLQILETRSINPQELVFLLKICLNKIDYDSINDLLRLMKLDLIKPEVLINLLLLDLKVEKEPIPLRDFNKNFLVHSAIFDRLLLTKEICWAYCRVLKGDFLIFSELSEIINDTNVPQNHKYFAGILTGLIGVKNYIHRDPKIEKCISTGGIHHYSLLINSHFNRFKKGEKENSLEYAQYILQSRQSEFNIHPFWLPIVEIFDDSYANKKQTSAQHKPVGQIPFLRESKDAESKESYLMNFIAIYNLVNADETVIEFLFDFAFFKNILRYLSNPNNQRKLNGELSAVNEQLIEFYRGLVKEYKWMAKKLIKDKKIIFDYEHFDKMTNPIFKGMFMDACMTDTKPLNADFYLYFNKPVFQQWKEDLHRRLDDPLVTDNDKERDKIDRLTRKIEELFRGKNLMVDAFKMFVTHENVTSKDYWDRKFEEVEYLDDFLDSLVDVFMRSLDQTLGLFSKFKLNQSFDIDDDQNSMDTTHNYNDVIENDVADQYSFDDESEEKLIDMNNIRLNVDGHADEDSLGVKWFGLPIYIMLNKLRKYQTLFSNDKDEKYEEILYVSNMLFGFLEKSLYFINAGRSFRKFMYFSQFNFSLGVRMRTKSWTKYVGSLFMPEVLQYTKRLKQEYSCENEVEMQVIRSKVIKDIFENDRTYFPNIGIFAQFKYDDSRQEMQTVDSFINLAVRKMDIRKITQEQTKLGKREEDSDLMKEYYTLCFFAAPEYRDINSKSRNDFLSGVNSTKVQRDETSKDPVFISVKLLHQGFYGQISAEEIGVISETYFERKITKSTKDLASVKTNPFKLEAQHIKLLNDLALGKYSVLTESKNIFTEDIQLATHQKIYESILHLHSSKRSFTSSILMESLKTLSEHLSSNIYNLHSILEFVVSPHIDAAVDGEDPRRVSPKDYYIFRELGLKNSSFYHIFLLHTYDNDVRMVYIEKIIEDIGITDNSKIKYIFKMLLNLCYLVISDREAAFNKHEFKVLAEAILGPSSPESLDDGKADDYQEKSKADDAKDGDLISLIYTRINNRNKKIKNNLVIESFYHMIVKRGKYRYPYDSNLVTCFKNFILDITGKNKKSYLVKFENESDSIKKIFGVENSKLMNVFDIINWVMTSHMKKIEIIKENVTFFFDSPSFADRPAVGGEKLFELFIFISAFHRFDLDTVLSSLKSLHMMEEYCYILSYSCYISLLNDAVDPEAVAQPGIAKQFAYLLAYVLVQQIHSSVIMADANIHRDIRKAMDDNFKRLLRKIYSLDLQSMLQCVVGDEYKKYRQELSGEKKGYQRLFQGGVFKPFEEHVSQTLDDYFKVSSSTVFMKHAIFKLKNLFFFKPDFFVDNDTILSQQPVESSKIFSLIRSARSLKEHWEKTSEDLDENAKELLGMNFEPLSKKIIPPSHIDFEFMNVGQYEKEQLTNFTYPALAFMFIYMRSVRTIIDRNDTGTRHNLIIQVLTFMWLLFTSMKQKFAKEGEKDVMDPIDYLYRREKKDKVEFINKYASLLCQLKLKKSNLLILKDLIRFATKYIFSDKQRLENYDHNKPVEAIVNEIKFDSFMELYDYLDELENGKGISENYKENIVNLFDKILEQFERFKKHKQDIKNIVKLIQGDTSKIDYFIDKLFLKSESANYARSNIKTFMSAHKKVAHLSADGPKLDEAAISLEDRDILYKRAIDGHATTSDIFIIMRNKQLHNTAISFNEVELIFRRIGIELTTHRFCEFLAATKLIKSKKTIGYTRLNFSFIEENEFESLYQYIEDSVATLAKHRMAISNSRLFNATIALAGLYLAVVVALSNLAVYFYQGELFGSILMSVVAAVIAIYMAFVIAPRRYHKEAVHPLVAAAFEVVTTSQCELIL